MLLRLILAIVIALSAAPAMAMPACHGDMPTMAAMDHHGDDRPAKAVPHEVLCFGCVAPATLRPPMLSAPMTVSAVPLIAQAPTGLALATYPPATPPPRLG